MKKPYSIPKLVKYDDLKKTWYVYFRYKGKSQPIKRTEGINYFHTYKERETAGKAVVKYYTDKLESGWNPLVPEIKEHSTSYTLFQTLEFAIEKKKLELDRKTISGYEGTARFVKAAISELGLGSLKIKETKRVHIKTILETAKKQRKWSNKAYNKHLGHIQALLSEAVQWDVIEVNPSLKIKRLKVEDSNANRVPTPSEHKLIKYTLQTKYPDFYDYLEVEFHTGIRPVEITKLTFGMVDKINRMFILPASITKSRKKERRVPINDHLWKSLQKRFIVEHPKDYYLFGSYRPSGQGNRGWHEDFIPAPTKMKRDTVTKRWYKIVKVGLGINVNLYAYKHYGADMKIISGVPLEALQVLYGHQSKQMTEIYARKVKDVYRDVIVKLSPEM